MSASDLEGYTIVDTPSGKTISTLVDGNLKGRKEMSLDEEFEKDPLAVHNRLVNAGDIDRLLELYEDHPEAASRTKIQADVDALHSYKEIRERRIRLEQVDIKMEAVMSTMGALAKLVKVELEETRSSERSLKASVGGEI